MLIPKKPFALTKPLQLLINGMAPAGLQDAEGRLIDGNHDGVAGGNAIALLSRKGATVASISLARTSTHAQPKAHLVDAVLESRE